MFLLGGEMKDCGNYAKRGIAVLVENTAPPHAVPRVMNARQAAARVRRILSFVNHVTVVGMHHLMRV